MREAKKVLIYSGTTEGRTLAEQLAKAGVYCDVCVATEYGCQVMSESEYISVLEGRLDISQMKELYAKGCYDVIVDATHPFATVVSENIGRSLLEYDELKTPFYRVRRNVEIDDGKEDQITRCDSISNCIDALSSTKGRILLTTGSKELNSFCENEDLKRRLVVRVLPGKVSIDLCYENGLEGKQIIAMHGPFSKEMNLALIHQYDISVLVTKESGKTGGVDEKIAAAKEAGIACFVIGRPSENSEGIVIDNVDDALDKIVKTLGLSVNKSNECDCERDTIKCEELKKDSHLQVVLAGIGMGAKDSMTKEVSDQIAKSDYIFGAKRMLESAWTKATKYPYYTVNDIVPELDRIHNERLDGAVITILFSGDTGFFSGCEKLYNALENIDYVNAKIMPGISTIVALSARLGVSWQDANIVSTHGVDLSEWTSKLVNSVRYNRKTFFLSSGVEDVRKIGALIEESAPNSDIHLGFQLSYENEEIIACDAKRCQTLDKPGLYAGMIINNNPEKKIITHGINDDDFIRDKVPMTKEEVREISICKLNLNKDSVVYDIGAGTGSVSVEIASMSPDISVYAVETKQEAVELIHRNIEKFRLHNINVIEACAPNGMAELQAPTHAFIGGSKGNLKEILDFLYARNNSMRVVVNAVSIETVAKMTELMNLYPIKNSEIVQVSVSRAKKLGEYNLMQANNPVYIFAFDFAGEE